MRLSTFLLICTVFTAAPAFAAVHGLGEDPIDEKIEAQMQPSWRACSTGENCQLIAYGCDGFIAANKSYITETTELAYRIGGNPAAIKCSTGRPTYYVASCLDHHCFATNPTE